MNCNNCGSYVPDGQAFCGSCGTPTSSNDSTQIIRRGTSPFAKKLENTQEVESSPEIASAAQAPVINPDVQSTVSSVNAQQPVVSAFAQQPASSPFAQPTANSPFSQQPTVSPFAQQPTSSPFAQQPANTSFAQPIQPVYQKAADPQPFNQQPVYQQPTYQQPVNYAPVATTVSETKPKKEHGTSIAALILGVLGLLFCWIKYLNVLISLPALVFSILGIARKNSDKVRAIVALCFAIPAFLISCSVNSSKTKKQENSTPQTEANVIVEIVNETTTVATETEIETPLTFTVAGGTSNLHIGEIAKDGEYYYGLTCVRSLDEVQTAVGDYTVEIPDSQEVIYPIIEVYNCSSSEHTFQNDCISVYADSMKCADPDTSYLVGVDDIEQLHWYTIDPYKTGLFVDAFTAEKGWQELTVCIGNVSWKITPEDVSYETYTFNSLFNLSPEYSYTEVGSKIYDQDYEVIFDGFEIYESENRYIGTEKYGVFEFTINNTSENILDYSDVGSMMKGYWNTQLLDDASWTLNETISGYTNVYSIEQIHAGMTAKVYVAFEMFGDGGVYECYFDVGYVSSKRIGYVCYNYVVDDTESEETTEDE